MSNGSFEIGDITILNAPTDPQHGATKAYVDSAVSGPQGTPAQKRHLYEAQKQSNAASYSVSSWTPQLAQANNGFQGICWSPDLGLFAAVSSDGGTNQVITSTNGKDWTLQNSTLNSAWASICWASELGLFVAVDLPSPHVLTSPDGANWTQHNSPMSTWTGICWSPDLSLLVAVAKDTLGGGTQVMTSPNTTSWTARTQAETNAWQSVCWSSELGLFCAVSSDGTHRVMTSDNGINWVAQTAATAQTWKSVCWSPELNLFCAVGNDTNSIMTSDNGVNWVSQTATGVSVGGWNSICWAPELNLFVAVPILNGDGIITSSNGIDWKIQPKSENNTWMSVCWAPEIKLFAAVSFDGAHRVMTSRRFDDIGAKGLSGDLCFTDNPDSNAGGFNTGAFGVQSFTMGFQSQAYGKRSTAIGKESFCTGDYSFAEGFSFAASDGCHSEGRGIAGNQNSFNFNVSGTSVTLPGSDFTSFFPGSQARFYALTGGTNNILNVADRGISALTFNGTDTTLTIDSPLDDRTGGTMVDNTIGENAHAEGNNTNATGDNSHAEGKNTTASGLDSHAEGRNTSATANYTHAEGETTTASGQAAHAEGNSATASGDTSHAEGNSTQATNTAAHAEGDTTTASGAGAHAEGSGTTASGDDSHAEGIANVSSGPGSHAEGAGNFARNSCSHAEGNTTAANGIYSHVEGLFSIANGDESHAEGQSSQSNGVVSHAEGNTAIANGNNSHVEGINTFASGDSSHVEGNACRTGFPPSTFTFTPSTVTIAGDVTDRFNNGDAVEFYALTGGTNNVAFSGRSAISSVTFGGGNTTFTITPGTIDDRTGGLCVDTAFGQNSHVEGLRSVSTSTSSNPAHVQGTEAYVSKNGTGWHAEANGNFSTRGDAQSIRMVMHEFTTDASIHQMGNPDQWWWTPDSGLETAYAVTLTVFAKESAGGSGGRAMWKRMFIVETNSTNMWGAGTTIGTDINSGSPASTWTINTVSPTNQGNLQINVNGQGSNVLWVALIEAIQISG